jgi:Tol biopolymer transport system component
MAMHTANYWLGCSWSSIALAIIAAMLTMSASVAAEEQITPVSQLVSPDRQRVAYGQIAVGPNGDQKVRIIVGNVDGSQRRALPIDAEAVDEVQWYGNDRIAYVTKHGEDGYQLIDLEGKPAGELRMPPGCDSYFHQCLSPDGKTIAFCGNYAKIDQRFESVDERLQYFEDHPEVEQAHGLFLADLTTQSVKQALDKTVANLPAWSPDSKYLACGVGHYVKDYPLVIIERESGESRRSEAKGTAAAWSPDSRRLAIVTDVVKGGSWLGGIPMDGAIGVLDAANFIQSGQTQLTRVSAPSTNVSVKDPYSWLISGSYGAVWSPDGKRLAYRHGDSSRTAAKAKTKREEVWIVRPDGSEPRKVLNHGAEELAWGDECTLLWVNEGQFGRIDVDLDGAAALGPTPEVSGNRFAVVGKVTDGEGRPMEGVEVRAATGMGTLHTGAPVKTDAAGRYELHFGPGIWSPEGGPDLQAATIYARKAGFYERDLCRNGNLGMANYRPKNLDDADWHFQAIVYPGQPYQLDFVMLPAAQVIVELVNADGEPLADYALKLSGDELYPSSNILESQKTKEGGTAEFDNVPLKPYWFYLGQRDEIRTTPIDFSKPGAVRYRLTYDDIAGTLTAEGR